MNSIKNNIDNESKYKKHFFSNKNIVCCNCGKIGHLYKKCFNPITSLGIICFKKNDLKSIENNISKNNWNTFISKYKEQKKENFSNNFKFLLIRRKDSLSFAELVRVKYNINDVDYIKKMLQNMSIDEYHFLKNAKTADDLWNRLWTSKKKSRTRIYEYNKIKKKLNLLINGTLDKNGNLFNIKSLLDDITPTRQTPEWGFPKGRRVPKETNIQCSIREFCEETDIDKSNFNVLKNIGPVEEIFIGSNNVNYKHIYYIAEIKNDISLELNPDNVHQKAEIGDIQWFTPEETIEKLEITNSTSNKVLMCFISFN